MSEDTVALNETLLSSPVLFKLYVVPCIDSGHAIVRRA